jgi:hypothetical protein
VIDKGVTAQVSSDAFSKLPVWRQKAAKKKLGLY